MRTPHPFSAEYAKETRPGLRESTGR